MFPLVLSRTAAAVSPGSKGSEAEVTAAVHHAARVVPAVRNWIVTLDRVQVRGARVTAHHIQVVIHHSRPDSCAHTQNIVYIKLTVKYITFIFIT